MSMIIYGECTGATGTSSVRICELANEGCHLEADRPADMLDCELSLWIGAVGPFAARATSHQASRVAVRFNEPLDGRILQHFSA